jgi:BirA family biotin operon repressor/biotin-[acetyl-CoA-carboxylase] ligase
MTLAVAVAVAEGVRGFVGRPPAVKWPNDLLYAGRKLCGILCELVTEEQRIKHLVVGVGLNVNSEGFASGLNATSLRLERGSPVQRALVLASVLAAMERWIERLQDDGPAPVLEAWLALCDWMGQAVSVRQGDRQLRGTALGLDERGGLRLRLEDGSEEVVVAGDLALHVESH